MVKRIRNALLMWVLLPFSMCQDDGKAIVTGTISSDLGGRIPGAEIRITGSRSAVPTLPASDHESTFKSDEQGKFRAELDPGLYRLEVKLEGFETALADLQAEAGSEHVVDFTLKVADVSVPLPIETDVPEHESPEESGPLSDHEIPEIPVGAAAPILLAFLIGLFWSVAYWIKQKSGFRWVAAGVAAAALIIVLLSAAQEEEFNMALSVSAETALSMFFLFALVQCLGFLMVLRRNGAAKSTPNLMLRLLLGIFLACISPALAVGTMLSGEDEYPWVGLTFAFLGSLAGLVILVKVAGQGRSWSLIVAVFYALLALLFGLATAGAYQDAEHDFPPIILLALMALQIALASFFIFNLRKFRSRPAAWKPTETRNAETDVVFDVTQEGAGQFFSQLEQSIIGRVTLFAFSTAVAIAAVHVLPVGEAYRLTAFFGVLILGLVSSNVISEELARQLWPWGGKGNDDKEQS